MNMMQTSGKQDAPPCHPPSGIRSILNRGKPAAGAAGAADQPQGRDAGGVPRSATINDMDTARLGLDHQPFGDAIALKGDDVARLDR
jgi:hypothetical protein